MRDADYVAQATGTSSALWAASWPRLSDAERATVKCMADVIKCLKVLAAGLGTEEGWDIEG